MFGILREQERQRGGTGAGQAQPDERRHDGHVVDLRVTPVPVLDLQALREVTHDPRVQVRLADRVEARLVAQRPHEDLETLAERVVAEVVEAGLARSPRP